MSRAIQTTNPKRRKRERRRRRRIFRISLLLTNVLPLMNLYQPSSVPFENCLQRLVPLLLVLISLGCPLTYSATPLIDRLPFGPHFPFNGRDVFTMYHHHRYLFWLNTGELPETLEQLVHDVTPELRRHNRDGNLRQRQRRGKLNLKNQVLLVMIWLRKYPCLDSLALLFDVSRQTVSTIIYHVVPVLWRYFQSQVSWPSLAEWNAMRGSWPSFPNAVG